MPLRRPERRFYFEVITLKENRWRPALRAAFPHTVPIMAGFLFLGMAYGILMRSKGFHPLYPTVMAMTIFGGSLEYVCAEMLCSAFAPLETLLMALLIQARHLFYGLAMLDKYRGHGWKTPLLIFGMCDESFSINCSVEVPKDVEVRPRPDERQRLHAIAEKSLRQGSSLTKAEVDRGWFYLWITVLNWAYWVIGATLGAWLGAVLPFSTEGIEFVMTAMFAVIFLDAWLKEKQHISSLIGLGCAVGCLLLLGAEDFMLPAMGCILLALLALRKPIERAEQKPRPHEGGGKP